MWERRGLRFALEVLFLGALAAALAAGGARTYVIAGVMACAWVLVAAVEWASWRDEPRYSAGLPPDWVVPGPVLPPPRPVERVVEGYPAPREEAPTWIASPELRDSVLGAWPVPALGDPPDEPGGDPAAP